MGDWLRARSNALVDSLIGAAALALLGLLVVAWRRSLVVVVVLAAFAAALLIGRRLLLRRRSGRAVRVHAEPTDDLRLALSRVLVPHPLLIDDLHHFTLVRESFRIDGQDGIYELHYEGTNVSGRPSHCLRDTLAGDSPMDIADLEISARDPVDSQPLAWSAVVDEPYRKIIEVRFQRPVLPGEHFRLAWSCRWRGTFTRRDDYVFFPAGHRRRGVETLRGELILSARPAFVEGVHYNGKWMVTSASQPMTTVHDDGSCTVVWELDRLPERSVPVILFKRTGPPPA